MNKTMQKRRACASIERALRQLDVDGRQPDQWESEELAYAIGSLRRYAYRLAEAAAESVLSAIGAPTARRDRAIHAATPGLPRQDLRTLWAAFEEARACSAMPFPELGRIVYRDALATF